MGEKLELFIEVKSINPIQGHYFNKRYPAETHCVHYRKESSVFSIEEGSDIADSESVFIGDFRNFYVITELQPINM